MKRKILDTYVLHSTARIRQLLTLLVLLLASTTVFAQFPRQVSFTTNAASGFRVGGNAVLTGTSTTSTDGVLRLTSNNTHEAGFAIDDFSFPAPSGFSISFEFFSYGGTGADGFSVFLIDADKTSSTNFTSGASGGALGYAQRNITPINKGVPNGYIGIGLDEFGNFSSGTEGRVGGPGVVPDAVVIRGSGSGQDAASTTDYPYLAGNGRLPFSLDVNSTERVTDPQNPNYRRAYIDVVPQPDGTYKIRVQIQHGTAIQTAIENVTVPKPPANLRIGFAGSTGGSTNYHEIRNLAVLQSPVAMDDRAGTRYDQPVSFSAIANDLFQYSTYKPGGVDLDPSTDGIQSTYTVAGKGTFIVSTEGQVTFTPSGTYAGIVTIPYTVQDLIGSKASPAYQSNPANITVVVSGADVATTISGPTAANPGASVTYTVSTLNIGRETALNVVPTLQLSTSATNIVLPDGATRSASNLITFPAIASLESSAAPMTYAVTFTLPTSGSITGTTNFTATTPDLNLGNNSSALTTNTVGISNVASGCAAPGQDGAVTLTSTAQPNTYYPGLSVAADKKSIKLGQVRNTAGTPITAGDLLLVMQMQGADINTTSGDATYGTDIISATGHTAGQYEYAIATGPVAVDGTLPLQAALQNTYTNQDYTTATGGQRRFQVIRVPQYASLTINGTVTGLSWDGTTGGVLVVDVAGETKFATNAVLDMNGRGFRGGAGKRYLGNASYTKTDYYNVAVAGTDGAHGSKGEGFAGTPRFTNDGLDNGVEGYVNGSVGAGAPGNAGGGGTDAAAANGNSSNAGGGGGGNGGNGGSGGKYGSILGLGQTLSLDGIGGQFGRAASLASSSRLYLGGGGGAGSTNATDPSTSRGANGGGIIILRTGTVSGTGTIKADGNAGASGYNGGGGGGAGGTVVINTQVATSLSNITVSTVGGNGGKVSDPNPLVALLSYKGGGGGGGGGRIYANNTLNAATSAAGGSLGSGVNVGTNGVVGVSGTVQAATTTSIPTGISSNFSCLPMLTASLTTSTPQLSRSSTGVKPAIYTITVTNSGGQANNVSAMVTMGNGTSRTTGGSATGTANGLIKYKAGSAVVKLTSANGTVTELLAVAGRGQAVSDRYTQPTADSSTPTFSNITMPAGSTLTITYVADVASSAVNNTPYQSGVQVSYPDPTRTSDANWATPGTMYTAMPSTAVPGSNYVSTSSAAEDIIIAQPLPVELKQFNVAAVRQDAQLTWSTASEKNNDRFEVERSLDGEVFARIGTVKGIGYSTQTQTYHYFDANVARLSAGHPLYYRLHQVDTDGTDTYSPVRVIRFEAALETTVSVYPNPTQAQATLELTSLPAGNYQVRILDMTGRVLREQTLTGQQQHQLSVAELPMGTYLVQVRGANTSVTLPLLRN